MTRRDRGTRSQRIQRLVDIAAAEEHRLATSFGKVNAELRSQQSQLGELHAYRQSYSPASPGTPALHSAHWKDYQNFRARLDQALSAQQQIVSDAEQAAATARQIWMRQRRRLESLKKVRERYLSDERLRRDRLEQKQQDDAGTNRAAFPIRRDEAK